MRAYAAAASHEERQHEDAPSTLILTAFFHGQQDIHGGAFSRANRGLRHALDQLIDESPGLCSLGRRAMLHVLHDQKDAISWRAGVELRRVTTMANSSFAHERRWILYAELLADASWYPQAQCVWLVDLTDVRVVRLPPCASLMQSSPERLWVGADVMSSKSAAKAVKAWIWSRAVATGFNATLSARRRRKWLTWLHDSTAQPCNAGIVGGGRATVQRAVESIADGVRSNERAQQQEPLAAARPRSSGLDMLLWNDYCIHGPRASSGDSLGSGYPFGPLHMPMSAQVRTESGRPCTEQCRHDFVRAVRGLYWFTHKAPASWARRAALGDGSCNAAAEGGEPLDDHESRLDAQYRLNVAAAKAVEAEPRVPFWVRASS